MRYLVTGSAGFIGSHLYEVLEAEGHDVVGVDCFTDYYDVALKEENARGQQLLRARPRTRRASPWTRSTASFISPASPACAASGPVFETYLDRNILASQRLFEDAARASVRVVFASTSSVYGDAERYPTAEDVVPRPVSPYGITKLACEHLVRATTRSFGLDAVVLRYFSVYGPRQRPDMAFTRVATALAEERPFEVHGDGGQSRSFTYVRDVVDATIEAMRAGRGTYNVGGGEEATLRETIDMLEEISGRTLELRHAAVAAGDQRRSCADTSAIHRDLGWSPTTPLRDGLVAQWEWAAARVGAR